LKICLPSRSAVVCVAVPAALAVVSAALMALAVASPRHFWLGWVTLIPLLFAIRTLRATGAVAFAALWGTSLFAFAAYLLPTMIVPSLGTWVLMTLVPALYALFGVRVMHRVGFSPLLLALGWVGVELALRPIGLRHGLLAATQGDGMLLRLIGSYAGYVMVAFLVVYINAVLLTLLAGVRIPIPGRRLVRATGDPVLKVSYTETPNYWFLLLRPSKPRAPPSVA
jgi:apolipoprotein N-acyltransferase